MNRRTIMKITISQEGSSDIVTFDIPDNPSSRSTEGLYLGIPKVKTKPLYFPKSMDEFISNPSLKQIIPKLKDYCSKNGIKICSKSEAEPYIAKGKLSFGSKSKYINNKKYVKKEKWVNVGGINIRFAYEEHVKSLPIKGTESGIFTVATIQGVVYLSDKNTAKKGTIFSKDVIFAQTKKRKIKDGI